MTYCRRCGLFIPNRVLKRFFIILGVRQILAICKLAGNKRSASTAIGGSGANGALTAGGQQQGSEAANKKTRRRWREQRGRRSPGAARGSGMETIEAEKGRKGRDNQKRQGSWKWTVEGTWKPGGNATWEAIAFVSFCPSAKANRAEPGTLRHKDKAQGEISQSQGRGRHGAWGWAAGSSGQAAVGKWRQKLRLFRSPVFW